MQPLASLGLGSQTTSVLESLGTLPYTPLPRWESKAQKDQEQLAET